MRPEPGVSGEQPSNTPLFGLAPGGACRAGLSPGPLVSSYLTVSPLPAPPKRPLAVCSLLRFPSGFPGWPLASALLCGVRTFLGEAPDGLRRAPSRDPRGHLACPRSVPPASQAQTHRPERIGTVVPRDWRSGSAQDEDESRDDGDEPADPRKCPHPRSTHVARSLVGVGHHRGREARVAVEPTDRGSDLRGFPSGPAGIGVRRTGLAHGDSLVGRGATPRRVPARAPSPCICDTPATKMHARTRRPPAQRSAGSGVRRTGTSSPPERGRMRAAESVSAWGAGGSGRSRRATCASRPSRDARRRPCPTGTWARRRRAGPGRR